MTIDPLLLWLLFCGCTIIGYIAGQLLARKSSDDQVAAMGQALTKYVAERELEHRKRMAPPTAWTWETPVRWLNDEEEKK